MPKAMEYSEMNIMKMPMTHNDNTNTKTTHTVALLIRLDRGRESALRKWRPPRAHTGDVGDSRLLRLDYFSKLLNKLL
jgi:hypothetical protein